MLQPGANYANRTQKKNDNLISISPIYSALRVDSICMFLSAWNDSIWRNDGAVRNGWVAVIIRGRCLSGFV